MFLLVLMDSYKVGSQSSATKTSQQLDHFGY